MSPCGCGGGSVGAKVGIMAANRVVYVTVPRDDIDNYDPQVTFKTELEARSAAPEGHVARAIVV